MVSTCTLDMHLHIYVYLHTLSMQTCTHATNTPHKIPNYTCTYTHTHKKKPGISSFSESTYNLKLLCEKLWNSEFLWPSLHGVRTRVPMVIMVGDNEILFSCTARSGQCMVAAIICLLGLLFRAWNQCPRDLAQA